MEEVYLPRKDDNSAPSIEIATRTEIFPSDLLQRLKAIGRSEGTTLPAIFLGAYQTLLYRYNSDEEASFPTASRNGYGMEAPGSSFGIAGLSGNLTFRQLLRRLRSAAPSPAADENAPRLAAIQTGGDPRLAPLFQTQLALVITPRPKFRLPAFDPRSFATRSGRPQPDFGLSLIETPDGLSCTVLYATDLFDAITIRRFLGHFGMVLHGIATSPDSDIAELPLLPDEERNLIVSQWNDTSVDLPRDLCLHQLIEQQVERTPDAPALIFESQRLTYRELNARANQLAHRLRKLGAGPDVLVGVCAERSVEMVVGLLGILKAGAAYLPLDPEHPRERLAMLMEDVAPGVVLTQERFQKFLPQYGAPAICLDCDWHTVAAEPAANPECITNGKDQAYAIFTSGSTGKPKGVPNVHEGIVNRLLWMQHAYQLDASDRVMQKTPYSFDVSVWEFFWPLMTGACLVVARPQGHKDPNYLIDLILQHKITTMHFVPSMLRVFLEAGRVEQCTSLRRVICSGEALAFDLQQRFFQLLNAELHNLYGPTEASVDVTYWQCTHDSNLNIVPIGKPIWNTQIYILDKRMQPVPIGVPGELHIGGVGLARGYLNRPQLTAEKFVPDPFRKGRGARLYKAGDLARFLPGGEIQYLGRIDHQVKLRGGVRVELGEIEATLASCPDVRQSVVASMEDPTGEKRLVAYVVCGPQPHDSAQLRAVDSVGQVAQPAMTSDKRISRPSKVFLSRETVTQLRSFLRLKLPEFMIPSLFVGIDSIPLTGSGKVDRRALPTPDWSYSEVRNDYVPPLTPLEEAIAAVFGNVLKIEQIGRNDHFFELGGHSLTAAEAVLRLSENLEVTVPLACLIESPTVAALAEAVAGLQRLGRTYEMPSIVPSQKRLGLPLSIAQEALWYQDQLAPGNPVYNIPLVSRLRGPLDVAALEKAIAATVERHELLRSVFLSSNGRPLLFPVKKSRGKLEQVDLRHVPVSEREREGQRLVRDASVRPFDLARDPMLRCFLAQLADDEFLFLHVSPHIVFDGGSIEVLYRDISAFYRAELLGGTPDLPPLPFQFADFAAWQRRCLQGEYLQDLVRYWQNQVTGAPNLNLPLDFPRPAVHTFRGTTKRLAIPADLVSSANALFRSARTTSFRGFYAAFNVFLYCYTGLPDICVGSPFASVNPSCKGIENLIGYFVNTLVLRTRVSPHLTFREIIRNVGEVVDGALAHSDLPFIKIAEAVKFTRDPSRTPLFQVNFRVLNEPICALQLGGVVADPPTYVDTGTAKFDLALEIESSAGQACYFEYCSALFREETIVQMGRDFQSLLRELIADPETPINNLPVVSEVIQRVQNRAGRVRSVA